MSVVFIYCLYRILSSVSKVKLNPRYWYPITELTGTDVEAQTSLDSSLGAQTTALVIFTTINLHEVCKTTKIT